jgi:acetolactate synthase-1/2/3 large subunit
VTTAPPRIGAHLAADALVAAGVRHLFSLSGNQILSLYDATIDRGLSILHTRHEAAAVHMADAWGRLTGEPGVALVTAGPGHLNAMSALYGALMAESPVVLLSGHAPLAQAGRGAFQEMDQVGAARPVTKAAWVAGDADRLDEDIDRALAIARSGRPGPVHVSLPGDVLESRLTAAGRVTVSGRLPGPAMPAPRAGAPAMPSASARAIAGLLAEAQRPLILVGPAMARPPRWEAVRRFSALTGVPALVMESPRGVNDPWLHLAATRLPEADGVLLLGKRLDFTVRFGEPPALAAGVRLAQIDAEASALGPGDRIAIAVEADPALAVEQLCEAAASLTWRHQAWGEEVAAARRTEPSGWDALRRSPRRPMHPLRVCAALQPLLDRGGILVADGGEFGQWAQAGLDAEIRLINGPSGSIGSALPMALAAKLARPERDVVAVVGDGTFGFHALELDTALRYGLPILVVVGNDARWNAEHQLQIQQYGAARAVGCQLLPSRYEGIAQALGGYGELVEAPEDLAPAIARAVESGRPACINAVIDGVAAPTYRAVSPSH